MTIPADNPITVDKATLGWQLWFDKRLSGKGDRYCYGCHVNEKGLTDGLAKNTNATTGAPLPRHTPTMWNIGYHTEWYWDGRAKTLEGQALAAWKLANMGAKDPEADKVRDDVIARINAVPAYTEQFQKVFGGPADEKNVRMALATYMRTIVSRDTPFDKFTNRRRDGAERRSRSAAGRRSRTPSAPTATTACSSPTSRTTTSASAWWTASPPTSAASPSPRKRRTRAPSRRRRCATSRARRPTSTTAAWRRCRKP